MSALLLTIFCYPQTHLLSQSADSLVKYPNKQGEKLPASITEEL